MEVVYRCGVLGSAWGLYTAAGGYRRNQVEWTNTMDLTTVDRVIQEPDTRAISDSMRAHPISTILDS